MRDSNRLYVTEDLAAGRRVALAPEQVHYLLNVLRLGDGDSVRLFNGRDGEWRAALRPAGRKRAEAEAVERLRPQDALPDVWLLFAPIKGARLDAIAEKATELGAARLCPVWTRRTVVTRINQDRLRAQMIEAAEQCERLQIPALAAPQDLDKLLSAWPPDRSLFFADEAGDAPPALRAFANEKAAPAAILIGPEGGFDASERALIRRLPQARPITLGPRILRADTAVFAALSLYQSTLGDWGKE